MPQVENFPTNSGFTPLADSDTKYPSSDDGKAKVANAGAEADFLHTTKEGPCDLDKFDSVVSPHPMEADIIAKRHK